MAEGGGQRVGDYSTDNLVGFRAVQDLIRSLVAIQSNEVKRYQGLLREAETRQEALIRAAYICAIDPKELIELSGVGKSKLFDRILNLKGNPAIRRQREAVEQQTREAVAVMTRSFEDAVHTPHGEEEL